MATYKGQAAEAQRAQQLIKKREKQLEELEIRKQKISDDNKISRIDNKFMAHYDAVEQTLKSSTIGLVTLDEMRAKQRHYVSEREKQIARDKKTRLHVDDSKDTRKKRRSEKPKSALSFDPDMPDEETDEDEEEDAHLVKKLKLGKDPTVDTSFLPDKEREEEENTLKEQFRQEWVVKQENMKREEIEITYSYWDGAGHRRAIKMRKGNSIHEFLHKCLQQLRGDFQELKTVTVDNLVYVKEDLIIPHHYSFYDFIVTKARGKSGPLFTFDVHDDIRLVADATVEKDESHAGKVVLRNWYEKNKHTFPACRWEPYDPEKNYDKYTISDKTVGVK